jgi:hypothetical protein
MKGHFAIVNGSKRIKNNHIRLPDFPHMRLRKADAIKKSPVPHSYR